MLSFLSEKDIKLGTEKDKKELLKKIKNTLDPKAYAFLKSIKSGVSKIARVGDTFRPFPCLKPLEKNKVPQRGKFLYIDNWATWCLPCVQSIKASLKNKFTIPKNVQVVYISFDRLREKALRFIKKRTFPKGVVHLYNEGGPKSQYAQSYNITGLPHYMVVGSDGKIKDLNPPHPDSKDFQKYLNQLGK